MTLRGLKWTSPGDGMRYFDLYHGGTGAGDNGSNGQTGTLSFPIEASGYGAILATRSGPSDEFQKLLYRMKSMTSDPSPATLTRPTSCTQVLVEIPATKPQPIPPPAWSASPAASFCSKYTARRSRAAMIPGVDVQYPWEDTPRRFHEKSMQVAPFFIDRFPVTNAQFKAFLEATHYAPKDPINFLRDWKNGTYPQGWENRPVTWVSLEDARAYASGRASAYRTSGSGNWQRKAQMVAFIHGATSGSQETSPLQTRVEPCTGPTLWMHIHRAQVLTVSWTWWATSGSGPTSTPTSTPAPPFCAGANTTSRKAPSGTSPRPIATRHSKLLLMAPGYDRSGGLGFRCVRDAQ